MAQLLRMQDAGTDPSCFNGTSCVIRRLWNKPDRFDKLGVGVGFYYRRFRLCARIGWTTDTRERSAIELGSALGSLRLTLLVSVVKVRITAAQAPSLDRAEPPIDVSACCTGCKRSEEARDDKA